MLFFSKEAAVTHEVALHCIQIYTSFDLQPSTRLFLQMGLGKKRVLSALAANWLCRCKGSRSAKSVDPKFIPIH